MVWGRGMKNIRVMMVVWVLRKLYNLQNIFFTNRGFLKSLTPSRTLRQQWVVESEAAENRDAQKSNRRGKWGETIPKPDKLSVIISHMLWDGTQSCSENIWEVVTESSSGFGLGSSHFPLPLDCRVPRFSAAPLSTAFCCLEVFVGVTDARKPLPYYLAVPDFVRKGLYARDF